MKKILFLLTLISLLCANPENPVVFLGEGHFTRQGNLLQIEASEKTIIDWESFSIAVEETTRFIQPDSAAIVLNRVSGNCISAIDGSLEANGKIILVNPNGIIISASAKILAADFIAATHDGLNLNDWSFEKKSDAPLSGSINMDGIIRAGLMKEENGSILLVADNVEVKGALEATGGRVDILGNRVAIEDHSLIDVSSDSQGGTVLIGGDFQGQNPEIPNAQISYLGQESQILADAKVGGNGGKVVLWSENGTYCYGTISARGGPDGGNGGFIEISSKGDWDFRGCVDLRGGLSGLDGELFLDPSTIIINGTGPTSPALPVCPATLYDPVIGTAIILDTDLSARLGMCNITLQTTSGVGGTGEIQVLQGVSTSWATANSLTLIADASISIQGEIICSGAGDLDFTAPDIRIGDTVNTLPVTVQTDGAITMTATNGEFRLVGGAGGGDVIVSNDEAFPTTINMLNGDLTLSSLTGADTVRLGDNTSGGALNINISNGDLHCTFSSGGSVLMQSTDSMQFDISRDWEIFGTVSNDFRLECPTNTGNGSTINVGSDFSCTISGSTDFEFDFSNPTPGITFNVGGNFITQSTASGDSGINISDSPSIFNVGGNWFQSSMGTGNVSHNFSTNDCTINVNGDLTLLNTNSASTTIFSPAQLFIQVGGDIFTLNTFSPPTFPPIALAGGAGLFIESGGSINFGDDSQILILGTGIIEVIANESILIGPSSTIDTVGGQINSLIIVVDNQAPTAPLIGNGGFIMDPTAVISGMGPLAPIQIFTALRSQNSILGMINGALFSTGPLNVNTATEQWGFYYPQTFVGSPFTVFYKEPQASANVLAVETQTIGTVFDYLEEFAAPIPYYDDLFCIRYEGDDFAKQLYSAPISGPYADFLGKDCMWIQIANYRKTYPQLQRWGYIYPLEGGR